MLGFNKNGEIEEVNCNQMGGNTMAERKLALKRAPKRPELDALYEKSRKHELSNEELKVQRASFVYGNAPEDSGITKESAKASVTRLRLKSNAV